MMGKEWDIRESCGCRMLGGRVARIVIRYPPNTSRTIITTMAFARYIATFKGCSLRKVAAQLDGLQHIPYM